MTVDEIYNSNQNYVNYIVETMDTEMSELRKLGYTYVNDKDIISISLTERNSLTLREVINKFITSKATKNIIEDIFLYNKNQNMVVSTRGTFDSDFFFNKYILDLKTEIPKSETDISKLIVIPQSNIKKLKNDYNYDNIPVISYIYPVNSNSYVQIIANGDRIRNILYNSNYERENIIIILDNNNKLISSNYDISEKNITIENILDVENQNNNIVTIGNEKYIITSKASSTSYFKYYVVFPVKSINNKVNSVTKNTLILILVFVFLGILMTAIFKKEIYQPIKKILTLLNVNPTDKKKNRNEFDTITQEINQRNIQNERIISKLNEQQPYTEEIFLNRIMCGIPCENSDETINNLNEKYLNYVVTAISSVSKFNTINEIKIGLDEILDEKYLIKKLYSHSNEIFYIVKVNSIEELSTEIMDILDNKYLEDKCNLIFGISNIYSDISLIKKACDESVRALKYRSVTNIRNIYLYSEISDIKSNAPRFSIDEEVQLINNVFNGNIKNVQLCLQKYINNTSQLPFKNQKDAYIYIINLLLMTMANKNIRFEDIFDRIEKDFLIEIEECNDIRHISESVIDFYSIISQYCSLDKKDNYNIMMEYVNANYHKGMCLELLAEKMNMSPSYVSTYFKKVTGKNFLSYINNLKVQKSKELLLKSNSSISEIAKILGFCDTNSFIRLFKKIEGTTPGSYKKQALYNDMSITIKEES